MRLLEVDQTLTPADHQTHRVYHFAVPGACTRLSVHVRYDPKYEAVEASAALVGQAIAQQRTDLLTRGVDARLADAWAHASVGPERVANLLTLSLDDAAGAYRGTAHRQPADMRLVLASDAASPGLVAGPLPEGDWRLTISVHTLVSPEVALSIQVAADTASSAPSGVCNST